MRTISLLEPKELEDIAKNAFTKSGLPKPRGFKILEQQDNDGEEIIVIGLLVTEDDDLGNSQQRIQTGGLIQTAVWKSGDSRTAIMRHVLVPDDAKPPAVATL